MIKIYYNKDGWVCERYPYNIERKNNSKFIEVTEEEYSKTLVYPNHYCWRVVNNKLILDKYEQETQQEIYEKELKELLNWFGLYDLQVSQYNRCIRTNVPYDNKYGTIEELDEQASINAARITELKNLLS